MTENDELNEYELFNDISILAKQRFWLEDTETPQPKISYENIEDPETRYTNNWFWILLTSKAKNDDCRKVYQLSHEIIHTIGYSGISNTNFFEEWLAVLFAIQCCKLFGKKWIIYDDYYKRNISSLERRNSEYNEPYKIVKKLFTNKEHLIKKIRVEKQAENKSTAFSDITKEEFLEILKGKYENEIDYLLKKFY
jgi:hypothetical protein